MKQQEIQDQMVYDVQTPQNGFPIPPVIVLLTIPDNLILTSTKGPN
jgi:hypothetical protein